MIRRRFLCGCLSAGILIGAKANAKELDAGCTAVLTSNESDLGNFSFNSGQSGADVDIGTTSGDASFDRALAVALSRMSDLFDVLPGFGFYREPDGESENAFATSQVLLDREDGTVGFGRRLIRKLFNEADKPEIQIIAICAHEFGHIAQYKRGVRGTLLEGSSTVKPLELHADYLAGYFAGVRRRHNPQFSAEYVALAQYNVGDELVDEAGHHGTHQERGDAVVAGFRAAYRDHMSFHDAFDAGVELYKYAQR